MPSKYRGAFAHVYDAIYGDRINPGGLEEPPEGAARHTLVESKYLSWDTELPASHLAAIDGVRNPTKWPSKEKHLVSGFSILTTFMAAYSISAYVSSVGAVAVEFHTARTAALAGMPVFQTAFAAAPMVLAPFSEIVGRKPVFLATYLLFNVCTLSLALVDNLAGVLVSRFWQGVGASTFSTMVGGIIADLYEPHERGIPMSIFATASFSGGIGELVSNYVLESLGWRWIHWHQLIINSVLMCLIAFFFRESRGPVLLSKRARILNAIEHDSQEDHEKGLQRRTIIMWKVKEEEERATLKRLIQVSLTRPFHLLFTEPVVFWFSMWISLSWALLFLFYESVPLTFASAYAFTQQQTGLILLATVIGSIIGNLCYPFQERLYREYGDRLPRIRLLRRLRGEVVSSTDRAWNPEARLYTACFLSIAMSIGMFLYGGVIRSQVPWIVPAISVAIVTFGSYSIYLAVFTYFADIYTTYASSAMAAQSFCRNTLAGALPLAVDSMFTHMGFLAASFLLGAVGLFLSFVPWILVLMGPRIRKRSRFAKNLHLDSTP